MIFLVQTQKVEEVADQGLQVRVVGLGGSLRSPSSTRMAVEYALRGATEDNAKTEMLDLSTYNLPFWGLERENLQAVERFRNEIRSADGIIIGTPEMHGSISGVLKNALDLTEIEDFEGKMLGLIGVAGGRMGAVEALTNLRTIGRSLHAWVVPAQVSISNSAAAFNLQGEPLDPELGYRLKEVGKEVAHFAGLHKCGNLAQFLRDWERRPLSTRRSNKE